MCAGFVGLHNERLAKHAELLRSRAAHQRRYYHQRHRKSWCQQYSSPAWNGSCVDWPGNIATVS